MKVLAAEKGVDLLLIDSGDLHDGTGLTDGYPAGGIDAHDVSTDFAAQDTRVFLNADYYITIQANKFVLELPYDVMAIGKCVSAFLV